MSKFLFRSYVALGDSLTEGLGDTEFETDREGKGWADRLAALLACEAVNVQHPFDYANLALRGSDSLAILTAQLERALELKPDLVTIMTGANDLVRLPARRSMIEHMLRGALTRLYNEGTHVVLVNTVRPTHISIARPMVSRSVQMSQLIAEVAAEFGTPIVDVNAIDEFARLDYWSGDLAHFSHRGHVVVANKVAESLGLELRDGTDIEAGRLRMTAAEYGKWFASDVLPFWGRRLRGVTAGTWLQPKHSCLQRLVDAPARAEHPIWLDDASVPVVA
jgi:phosphatidylinositol alpha 1,6-mannosyltransferase